MKRTPLWVSLLVVLVMSLVTSGLGVPTPAAAKAIGGADRATFNVVAPWGTKAQRWRLVRSVETAIRKVPKRSPGEARPTILIATFMLDRKRTVTELIEACRRGASVRVVLDDDVDNRQSRRLKRSLNGDNLRDRNRDGFADRPPKRGPCGRALTAKQKQARAETLAANKRKYYGSPVKAFQGKKGKQLQRAKKARAKTVARKAARRKAMPLQRTWGTDRSYVKVCKGACRGRGLNMHSKYFVFSQTGKARHVIKLSSSNLNSGGALKGWNDMYTIRGRVALYRKFQRIHRQMTSDTPAGDRLVQAKSGPYTVRFFPVKKWGKRYDPVMRDLSRVRCRTPLGRYNRTKIFVSMFYWRDPRGEYLAERLLTLARKGCTVQVILGAPGKKISRRIKSAGRRGLMRVYDSRWDLDYDGVPDSRTHAKFVLVKGSYGRRKKSYQVMTGSGNWVSGSLVGGDEVSLNIASKRAYKQYVRAWDRIRDRSRLIPRRR